MIVDDDINATAELVNKQKGADTIFYGLDVGRVRDYSAISILVRHVLPIDLQTNVLLTRYYCVYLHRYPLNTPYEELEVDAARWYQWADVMGMRKFFVMDMTGVGAPVLEGIRKRRVPIYGITITGGTQEGKPSEMQYNVPKSALTTQLVRTAQTGRFKGYASLKNWKELSEELGSFGYKQNPETSTLSYESLDEKVHDDLVISVALPIWFGERVVPYRSPFRAGAQDADDYANYDPLARGSRATN